MKKLLNIGLLVFLMTGFVACYEDEGNYDYLNLPNVSIEAKDTVYATQFKLLEVPVEMNFDGDVEDNYEYSWRIWSNEPLGNRNQREIATTKDLSYELSDVLPGSYTLLLTCHNKRTDVNTYKEIYLSVQGLITEGWMVLHEKDGQSDFDLIMSPYFSNRASNDEVIHNLYESINGEPLEGRGVKIASYFCKGRYQDVIVLTDKGGARLSAITMQRTFDMSTLMKDMTDWNPENYLFWHYYWSPGYYGFDALISNGRFYIYSAIGDMGFTSYTEPILKDGIEYKASPYGPKWFDYYKGIIYDELGGRFLGIDNNTYELKDMAAPSAPQPFDWSDMHSTLRYMDTGYNYYEYGLMKDWDTGKHTLYVFNFDTKPNIAVTMHSADNCPELDDAKYFAIGSLGNVFYYATQSDIYQFDYAGTKEGKKVYSLANANEKITGMKIFKPCVDRYISSHPYNNKILILSTYNESTKEGKVYMYYVNVSNGTIDMDSEKVFGGFGEILDMEVNYPKYGS